MSRYKSKRKATRERILESALELFHEKGFDATTVKEITERANMAKGTFFNYFPTKESILGTLAMERLHNITCLLENERFKKSPLQLQIRSFLLQLLSQYDIMMTSLPGVCWL